MGEINTMVSLFEQKLWLIIDVCSASHSQFSFQDVVQSLVDDNLVDTDKIGTSVYFWAFPSKALAQRQSQLSQIQDKLDASKAKNEELNKVFQNASSGREDSDDRKVGTDIPNKSLLRTSSNCAHVNQALCIQLRLKWHPYIISTITMGLFRMEMKCFESPVTLFFKLNPIFPCLGFQMRYFSSLYLKGLQSYQRSKL